MAKDNKQTPEQLLAEEKALSAMREESGIAAKGSAKTVAIDSLYLEGNVRSASTELIPQMVASLRESGFKPNHPIVVSAKENGRNLVLCGNRRTKAVLWLRDNEPETFARIFPKGTLPAVIHKGLSVTQETLIRIDHGAAEDRISLDDFGLFQAVKQLVAVGHDTQAAIALKLGKFKKGPDGQPVPDRSWVQTRVDLAKLPADAQAEFGKLWTAGKDSTAFRVGDIARLRKAYNADLTAGAPGAIHGEGPEYRKAFAEIASGTPKQSNAKGEGSADGGGLSPAQLHSVSQGCNSRLGKELLAVASGRVKAPSIAEIDNAILEAESALSAMQALSAYYGADFPGMVESAREAAKASQPETADESEAEAELIAD